MINYRIEFNGGVIFDEKGNKLGYFGNCESVKKEEPKMNEYNVNVKFECKVNKTLQCGAKTSEEAVRDITKELSDPDILEKVAKHIKEELLCDKNATVSICLRQAEANKIEKGPLILICGKSGSGKTTIANQLTAKYGLKQLESYTTRPRRSDDEKGHMFMNDTRLLKQRSDGTYFMYTPSGIFWSNVPIVKDISGYKYWCTTKQLHEADIYVIDPKTALELEKKVRDERKVIIIYLTCPESTRVYRMAKRGDRLEDIQKRLINEEGWDENIVTSTYRRQRFDSGEYDAEWIAERIMSVYNFCLTGKCE